MTMQALSLESLFVSSLAFFQLTNLRMTDYKLALKRMDYACVLVQQVLFQAGHIIDQRLQPAFDSAQQRWICW